MTDEAVSCVEVESALCVVVSHGVDGSAAGACRRMCVERLIYQDSEVEEGRAFKVSYVHRCSLHAVDMGSMVTSIP